MDYEKAFRGEFHVLVRVGEDIFFQYNRAKSFNKETEEKQNRVTVVQTTEGGTELIAGLEPQRD